MLSSLHTSAELNTNQEITTIQITQALVKFEPKGKNPGTMFKQHALLRRRRALGIGPSRSTNEFWSSPLLARWSWSQASGLTIVKGPFSLRFSIQDFGVDVIQTLTAAKVPTIWGLTSLDRSRSRSLLCATEYVKYLIYQVLRIHDVLSTEKSLQLRSSHLDEAVTLSDCITLLSHLLASFRGQVYLVLDLASVFQPEEFSNEPPLILELLEMLRSSEIRQSAANVKILLLVYEADWIRGIPQSASAYTTIVKSANYKRLQGNQMQRATRTHILARRGGRA